MTANFKHLITAATLGLGLSLAHADDTTAPSPDKLTSDQAKDLKTQNKADYKARKKVADAQEDLNVADCKTAGLDSKNERDCKHDAKQATKQSKDAAKQLYKDENDAIKANKQ